MLVLFLLTSKEKALLPSLLHVSTNARRAECRAALVYAKDWTGVDLTGQGVVVCTYDLVTLCQSRNNALLRICQVGAVSCQVCVGGIRMWIPLSRYLGRLKCPDEETAARRLVRQAGHDHQRAGKREKKRQKKKDKPMSQIKKELDYTSSTGEAPLWFRPSARKTQRKAQFFFLCRYLCGG